MKINGYSFVEVLIGTVILFTVITTIGPITSQLFKEQAILSDRRIIIYTLHDELQPYLADKHMIPMSLKKNINGKNVFLMFIDENNYMKGCATWKNAREKQETTCLYGMPAT
ncbi:hypothetical protein [Oceanobacillus bengalensis]|uniref:Type II secretion system protein n=1 Tax=Oceanobacillus bengalensis TaxID=1435466 RepID=A0A494Z0K7_9BACI|nr:hypothetical protein [Oceanobacillus bengalensis]RKQ16019.1 hypothetical protein D8M05_07915 [Oceanobacillus bengalensis]